MLSWWNKVVDADFDYLNLIQPAVPIKQGR